MRDPADLAQANIEQQDAIREQQRLARQAEELRALNVTECEDCGCVIPDERKRVMPTARLCLECQRVDERRKALGGR